MASGRFTMLYALSKILDNITDNLDLSAFHICIMKILSMLGFLSTHDED
jgi:hypothetical protein